MRVCLDFRSTLTLTAVVSSDEDEDVEKEGDSLRENEKEVSGSEASEDDEASEESFYSASEGDIDLTALHL